MGQGPQGKNNELLAMTEPYRGFWVFVMATPVSRAAVQAFLQAFASRDPARLGACLHDDIVWNIAGPIDLMRFCGEYRGKTAVLDVVTRVVPGVMRVTGYDPEVLLIDGDRCATLGRIMGTTLDGRVVTYRCAQFVQFKDDKAIEFRSITDTFDAAEQLLGHPLDPAATGTPDMADNLIAV
jgi:ketosteroid isomerase-like protein